MEDLATAADEVPVDDRAQHLPEDGTGMLRHATEVFFVCAIAFMLTLGVKTFIIQPFFIPSGSMEPTLQSGDRILVSKVAYRFGEPMPGDIVVFTSPEDPDTDLIKRIVAVSGQTVDIDEGVVTVDGVRIEEPYVPDEARDDWSLVEPLTIPHGYVFVMGDNRSDSADSRIFGPQPVEAIHGRALAVYWPPADLRKL